MLYLERWYKPCHLQVIFNGPSIKRWLNTLYTYVHWVKNIKNNLKNLHVLMVPWYTKVQMISFKTFNIKCFLNRLLKHSKFSAGFTEISRLCQSCLPRYLIPTIMTYAVNSDVPYIDNTSNNEVCHRL